MNTPFGLKFNRLFILVFVCNILQANVSINYYQNSQKLSEFTQINKGNIDDLELSWEYNSGEISPKASIQASPVFTGQHLITVGIFGSLIALDPSLGKEIWKKKYPTPLARRGMIFSREHNLLFVPFANGVMAINPINGNLIKEYNAGLTLVSPIVTSDNLYIATLEDGVKAYEINSEKLIWTFDVKIKKDADGPRIWSGFSYDPSSDLLLANTGNPGGLYGGNRLEQDLSSSLLAIDRRTGILRWKYQQVRHDLWDFDLVGPPILHDISYKNKTKRAVVSLTKTGEIIYLDVTNGMPIFQDSILKINTPPSDVPGEIASTFQYKITKPEPFSDRMEVDLRSGFNHLGTDNYNYVKHKTRYAKSGNYLPPSLNYDLVIYGLHGGAEWPGGAIASDDNSLIVPYNADPWILRIQHQDERYNKVRDLVNKIYSTLLNILDYLGIYDFVKNIVKGNSTDIKEDNSITKKIVRNNANARQPWEQPKSRDKLNKIIYRLLPSSKVNDFYDDNCSKCHGVSRSGFYQDADEGDMFVPSLVGINKQSKFNMDSISKFHSAHKNLNDFNVNISKDELRLLSKRFDEMDEYLFNNNKLIYEGFWQVLLDINFFPATKAPWGGIASVDLKSGKKTWDIPFGYKYNLNKTAKFEGDINFGGVLTTKSGIIFATGTSDELIRAYDDINGELIWSDIMNFAGSAPPVSYFYKGCQHIAVNNTGGQFMGYKNFGDSTRVYKLKNCKSDD